MTLKSLKIMRMIDLPQRLNFTFTENRPLSTPRT